MRVQTECPHCLSRFQVENTLLEQQIRCPECDELFLVADINLPQHASNNISNGTADYPPEEVMWQENLPNHPAEEIEWGEDVDFRLNQEQINDQPISQSNLTVVSSKKPPCKRRGGKLILFLLLLLVFGGLGTAGYFFQRYQKFAPERLWQDATKAYEDGNFENAARQFQLFATTYPNDIRTIEAEFFSELCGLRSTVGSVLTRNEPQNAIERWGKFRQFVSNDSYRTLATPDRFGLDIWQTGTKLTEDLLGKANDDFRLEDPQQAEKWLETIDELLQELDRYRPTSALAPEQLTIDRADLKRKILVARDRLKTMDELRQMLAMPDDAKIFAARKVLKARGLETDSAAQGLVQQAEQQIQQAANFLEIIPPLPATKWPYPQQNVIAVAPYVDTMQQRVLQGKAAIFTTIVAGVFYAFDESNGRLLWYRQVGRDALSEHLIITSNGSEPDRVALYSVFNGKYHFTVHQLNTGEMIWHHVLPTQPAGCAVAWENNTLYVPLGDDEGTVFQFDQSSGDHLGKIRVGRKIGTGLTLHPTASLLIVSAEANAIYLFHLRRNHDQVAPIKPVFVGAITTGHNSGQILHPPTVIDWKHEKGDQSYLQVAFSRGLSSSTVIFYALNKVLEEWVPPVPVHEIPCLGWITEPPVFDGETLFVCTDHGQVQLFGMNMPGNQDRAIYLLKTLENYHDTEMPIGAYVNQNAERLWYLVDGHLVQQQYRLTFDNGLQLLKTEHHTLIGDPLQRVQTGSRQESVFLVTQRDGAVYAGCYLTSNGQLLWQRQLAPSLQELVVQKDRIAVIDLHGSVHEIDLRSMANPAIYQTSRELTALADGFELLGDVAYSSEDKLSMLLHQQNASKHRVLWRTLYQNQLTTNIIDLPAAPAGRAVYYQDNWIIPLANGLLYRWNKIDDETLIEGPRWRITNSENNHTCILTASDENLLSTTATDISCWSWEANKSTFRLKSKLNLSSSLKVPPVYLSTQTPCLQLQYENGVIESRNANDLSLAPIARWDTGKLSKGPWAGQEFAGHFLNERSSAFFIFMNEKTVSCYSLDDPEKIWSWQCKHVIAKVILMDTSLAVTDENNTINILDLESGQQAYQPLNSISGSGIDKMVILPTGVLLMINSDGLIRQYRLQNAR
ncbi:MAG: hypothetical protein R3B84_04670 [Zavarzinella sp.]